MWWFGKCASSASELTTIQHYTNVYIIIVKLLVCNNRKTLQQGRLVHSLPGLCTNNCTNIDSWFCYKMHECVLCRWSFNCNYCWIISCAYLAVWTVLWKCHIVFLEVEAKTLENVPGISGLDVFLGLWSSESWPLLRTDGHRCRITDKVIVTWWQIAVKSSIVRILSLKL